MLIQLIYDEGGFVISAELVLVLTIAVLAMIVGLHEVAAAITFELNDIGNAIGALRQDYMYSGFRSQANGLVKSAVAGSAFLDDPDICDTNTSCDILVGVTGSQTSESAFY
jgi:hypothetical protein